MFLTISFLIIGFAALIKGADWLVEGASSVAKKIGVSPLIIGLTIVAFGTSMPELIVNIFASIQGSQALAIGNIVGSNVANILLILGISAIIFPLVAKSQTVRYEMSFAVGAMILLAILVISDQFFGGNSMFISRFDGAILLLGFAGFMFYIFRQTKKHPDRKLEKEESESVKEIKIGKSWLMIVAGVAGLTIGGKLIVDSATEIAATFGVSEGLIGLTIVAVGTSLPELMTSAVAAWRKNADIAIGNVVGSNIFNALWILGVSSLIRPLPFNANSLIDLFVAIGATLLLWAILLFNKHKIGRWNGVIFVVIYVAYIVFLVVQSK
ncbi:calcium/sodium antiporter [Candidatus Saccharibacteria bacterium]|nr:calcium/sodium antiporter [Candidatus Saccharibacteria bacterium]MCL1962692.1 calcium/sodium antiporter [Candidatus Saccharibacteria bacterium]